MKQRKHVHSGGAALLAAAIMALMLVPSAGAAVGTAGDEDARSRDSIFITANNEFNPANGVVSGSGTRRDPFVISGWNVSDVHIQNTSKYVTIRDNVVTGTLVLDWIGDRVKLVNNTIGDLRVNQNRERTGDRTSGYIAHNTFGVVGQLRHYDGVFANNTVGSPDQMNLPFSEERAVNFDGFNGAHFFDNTIYGYMDATLHGHHHSSGFGKKSHYHGKEAEPTDEHDHGTHAVEDHAMMDHTNRWHEVWIHNNKIYSSNSWALRYTDQNHAANDRTAASETNEDLNLPHVHHTRIHMEGNKLFGSGLMVDVFNANDKEKHTKIAHGVVDIKDNQITVQPALFGWSGGFNGIDVSQAQHLALRIVGNTIALDKGEQSTAPDVDVLGWNEGTSGIFMNTLDVGNVYVFGNELKDFSYGVRAANFTKTVKWWVRGLKTTRVQDPLYYDNSVKSQPKTKGKS
jgi:hypothetical protein